jgi:hypothetical protein
VTKVTNEDKIRVLFAAQITHDVKLAPILLKHEKETWGFLGDALSFGLFAHANRLQAA